MKTSNYTVNIIEPEFDGYLTQAREVKVAERILSKKVFLAVNDSPENWKEITKEEGDAIIAEQQKIREKEQTNL